MAKPSKEPSKSCALLAHPEPAVAWHTAIVRISAQVQVGNDKDFSLRHFGGDCSMIPGVSMRCPARGPMSSTNIVCNRRHSENDFSIRRVVVAIGESSPVISQADNLSTATNPNLNRNSQAPTVVRRPSLRWNCAYVVGRMHTQTPLRPASGAS